MRRLSVVDGIFLRTHAGLGTPIALQGLWRTSGPVDADRLYRLHDALRMGSLGRRVVRPGVPGARDRWQVNIRAHPLDLTEPITEERILPWADGRGTELDPRYGPGWRLSAAPLTTGGTLVVLTCSHVLADAHGLMFAVDAALTALGDHDGAAGSGTLYPGSDAESGDDPDSDWVDAAATWATVLSGTVRALPPVFRHVRAAGTGLLRSTRGRAPGEGGGGPEQPPGRRAIPARRTPERRPAGIGRGQHRTPDPDTALPAASLVLRCSVREWDRIAATLGGTANSLFIWFVANTLWSSGFPRRDLVASLPVDTRDEPRVDNDLAMTDIGISPVDGPAEIRAKSRAAYERRMSSPGGLPEEFLHIVSDRVAYLLSRGAGERDILCSNIGTIPSALHALGPHECTAVAARAIHPGLTRARRPRTRLSGYLCRFRGDYLLTLQSLDPAHTPGVDHLRRSAGQTARRMDLPLRPW